MKNLVLVLVACCFMCCLANRALGAEITGKAVDLRGVKIPNIGELVVTAESIQGTVLNRAKVKVDEAAGTYTLTIDDELLRASGSVLVNLRFEATGRLTFTTTVSGQNDQTVDAVLPTAQEMAEYMSYMQACQPRYYGPTPMRRRCCCCCGWRR
jgi:hypothetical protein